MKEVKFHVGITDKLTVKVGEFMSKCDLGITGISAPNFFQISGKIKKGETVISVEKKIRDAIESNGHKIDFIKVIEI